jgi:hypothetical protein
MKPLLESLLTVVVLSNITPQQSAGFRAKASSEKA